MQALGYVATAFLIGFCLLMIFDVTSNPSEPEPYKWDGVSHFGE